MGLGIILGKIFGTDAAVKSVVDNTAAALDKLVYTSEEKAEDQAKAVTEARSMVVKWMETTKGQNIARRGIALAVTSVWLIQYIAVMGIETAAVWVDNPEKIHETSKVLAENAQSMNSAMMLILAFYFSAPYMGDFAKGVLGKFGK